MGIFSRLFGGPSVEPTPVRTGAQFAELVLQSELPVIVDVWSSTCPPCKKLWPELVAVATKHQDRVRVVEISTEADRALLMDLEVRATPTIIIFDQGEEVGRMTGFRPRSWFTQMLDTEFPKDA